MLKPRLPQPLGAPGLRRLLLMCMAVGVVAGLGAVAFFVLLEATMALLLGGVAHYHPMQPGLEEALFVVAQGDTPVRWALLLLPALGGLVSGWITFTFAPETEGHGTDAAIEAYHYRDGYVRPRVPFVKAITSAITIGSGGSGGREGPIAQIGAGFASMLGTWLKVTPEERRVLMAAGMAAGVGAIFHAPFAGALFAAEVLYSGPDMEHEVFVPAFVTSIIAYSVFGGVFGFHPLFRTPDYTFTQPALLLPYALLGLISAGGGWLFVRVFYRVRSFFFTRLKGPLFLRPALGGLVVGLIGFFLPEALATGYGAVQACFNQDAGIGRTILELPTGAGFVDLFPASMSLVLVAAVFLTLIAVAKILTTAFSIGSGGSGGVFGPAVVIGGALGGATGLVMSHVFPGLDIMPGAFALVGMAGFFAGAANTPISTIIMVSEMTGNYDLLVPAMLVCIVAFMASRRWTLYEKQLPTRLDAPSKIGYMARAILRRITVRDVMDVCGRRRLRTVPPDAPFATLEHLHWDSDQESYPVVDGQGHLVGVVEDEDVRHFIPERDVSELLIASDMQHTAPVVTPDQTILVAVNLMATHDAEEVIVVDRDDPETPVGVLSRGDILDAYNQQVAAAGPLI